MHECKHERLLSPAHQRALSGVDESLPQGVFSVSKWVWGRGMRHHLMRAGRPFQRTHDQASLCFQLCGVNLRPAMPR